MEDILEWKPLKLRAEDDQDLQVFSQCLYEAIIISSEIHYNKNNKQFAMAIDRFTWENARGKGHLLMQVLSIIIINNVESVNMRELQEKNKIKNILSISNVDNNILIMLNNDEIITLKVKKWTCLLEDIGKPFMPVTIPSYSKNDL